MNQTTMNKQFYHKKSLGQHFLNSDYVPKQMCDAAGELEGETVFEIGPGTGILTKEILSRGAKVVAIEADERAIASLEETFVTEVASGQLTIYHHDARDLSDLSQFGLVNHSYIVIANIPYYLSGLLFRQLLDTECQPNTLVFLIQKELAERIARDGKESLLSLSVKAFGEPSYVCTVKRGHFTPPPNVDSAIVAVRDLSRQNFKEILPATTKDFFNILHLGFGQKRKQLLGNLAGSGEWSREVVAAALRAAAIPDNARAEDIPLQKWLSLTIHLFSTQNH